MVKRTRTLEEIGIDRGWLVPTGETTLTGTADVWLRYRDRIAPPYQHTFFSEGGVMWAMVTLDARDHLDTIAALEAEGFRRE